MRSRFVVCIGLLVLGVAGSVMTYNTILGQPPAAPPKPLPPELNPKPAPPPSGTVVPAVGVASPARKPAPFDRYRKYDQLPELTREIAFATLRGMEWLSRDAIHQTNGRFVPGINAALGKATEDDHFLKQALGAIALARSARLTGEEKYLVRAGQTILSLLAETPTDPANDKIRKPVQANNLCNRVGAAALLAIAIYELPEATPELRDCGEQLCQFLRANLKADGSVQFLEPGEPVNPEGIHQYPGPALAALAMSNRYAPSPWKKDALTKALAHYREHFRSSPHPAMACWLTCAFAEMHLQTKDAAFGEFVFEMIDWLVKLQYENSDLHRASWRGGFRAVVDGKVSATAPTVETAYSAMALADACRMISQMDRPDTARFDRYRTVLTRALQFLATLQYGEENTQHFAGHFRPVLVGAFHPSPTDGNLRLDHTAAAVCAFAQYLIAGADR
jgi:hypothetical protein